MSGASQLSNAIFSFESFGEPRTKGYFLKAKAKASWLRDGDVQRFSSNGKQWTQVQGEADAVETTFESTTRAAKELEFFGPEKTAWKKIKESLTGGEPLVAAYTLGPGDVVSFDKAARGEYILVQYLQS
jgi:hypothetical protein